MLISVESNSAQAAESGEIVSYEVTQTADDLQSYWTSERLAAASPRPFPPFPTTTPSERQPEAQVDAAPQAFETTRVPAASLSTFPYKAVGRLAFKWGGRDWHGSAFAVGYNVILTAAHNVHDQGVESTDIVFCPQYDKDGEFPIYHVRKVIVPPEWLATADKDYDFAFLLTDENMYPRCSRLELLYNMPRYQAIQWTALGYPGEPVPDYPFDGQHMWQCRGDAVPDDKYVVMENNLTRGQSGGPWLRPYYVGLGLGSANGLNGTGSTTTHKGKMLSPYFGDRLFKLYGDATNLTRAWEQHEGSQQCRGLLMRWGDLLASFPDRVVRYDPSDGRIKASAQIPHPSQYSVPLAFDNEQVYAGTLGSLVAMRISYERLDVVWNKPMRRVSPVNVLSHPVTGRLYVAAGNEVLELAPSTGDVLHNAVLHTDLVDVPVSMVADTNNLYVGIDRQVIAIPLDGLTRVAWHTSLPDAGARVTLLLAGTRLYAASAGKVYALAANSGELLFPSVTLPGPAGDVQLAADETFVYAGAAAHVTSIRNDFFKTFWTTPLPAESETPVTVLLHDRTLYAGCAGRMYQLHIQYGALMHSYTTTTDRYMRGVHLAASGTNLFFGAPNALASVQLMMQP